MSSSRNPSRKSRSTATAARPVAQDRFALACLLAAPRLDARLQRLLRRWREEPAERDQHTAALLLSARRIFLERPEPDRRY